MRRLLPAVAALGACLALAGPASAGNRMPAGVKRIGVTLTFPLTGSGSRKPVHRTLAGAATVRRVVGAADALRGAKVVGACPMFVRAGSELTVVFRGASGRILAETSVQVVLGSRGTSGTSACFPIHFTAGSHSQRLVGNSYLR